MQKEGRYVCVMLCHRDIKGRKFSYAYRSTRAVFFSTRRRDICRPNSRMLGANSRITEGSVFGIIVERGRWRGRGREKIDGWMDEYRSGWVGLVSERLIRI